MINTKSYSKNKNSDGTASGGGGYVSSGSEYAKALSTTHTIWGHPFNGTQDVSGNLNVPNLYVTEKIVSGGSIKTRSDVEVEGLLNAKGETSLKGGVSVGESPTKPADITIYGATKTKGTLETHRVEPEENGSYDLGTTEKQYGNIYCGNAWFTNLDVTGSAHFKELIIDKIKAAGGQVILSPATLKIDLQGSINVITDPSGILSGLPVDIKFQMFGTETVSKLQLIRCYQLRYDEETGKELINEWSVGDLVIHQTFNIGSGTHSEVSNSYFRSMVIFTGTETVDGVDYNYIDIIKSYNGNTWKYGTVSFGVGDELVQLGNCTNTSRQNAIILSAYNTALDNTVVAPAIVQYAGIKDFRALSNYKLNVIAANGNTFKGDFLAKSGNSYVQVDPNGIILEIKNGLKTTGIDIDAGTITFNADLSEFIGDNLNLWGDNAYMCIGDSDKTQRIHLINQEMPKYVYFGGGQISKVVHVVSDYTLNPGTETVETDYISLGKYKSGSTISVGCSLAYMSASGRDPSTGGGMGGGSVAYNSKIKVTSSVYKYDEDLEGYVELSCTTKTAESGVNDFDFDKSTFTFTASPDEDKEYFVKYYVVMYAMDNDAVNNHTTWEFKRDLCFIINFTPTYIIEKTMITKNGLGVIKGAKDLMYFGSDDANSRASFHLKCSLNENNTSQYYNNGIDVTYNHTNLMGNVNIQRKVATRTASTDSLFLFDADTWLITGVSNNALALSCLGGTDRLPGRRIRLYVACNIPKVGAARGQDIGVSGAGSKILVNYGGYTHRLPMIWYDGEWWNDSSNNASSGILSWSAGSTYEIEYFDDTTYILTKLG